MFLFFCYLKNSLYLSFREGTALLEIILIILNDFVLIILLSQKFFVPLHSQSCAHESARAKQDRNTQKAIKDKNNIMEHLLFK